MKKFEGNLVSSDIKIGIVAARFNEFITSKLLSGAMDGLLRHDVREEDISVPGVRVQPAIMIMSAMKCQKESQVCHFRPEFRLCLASLPLKILNRQSSVPEPRQATKVMTAHSALLRW